MAQIISLGPGSDGQIVKIEVIFPNGKGEIKSLTETQLKNMIQQYSDKYILFTSADEQTVQMYFDYYKYPDGNYAFICSDFPIQTGWWQI